MSNKKRPVSDSQHATVPIDALQARNQSEGFGLSLKLACELIANSIAPIDAVERVATDQAFERVLAGDLFRRSMCPRMTTRRWTDLPAALLTCPQTNRRN